MSKLSYNSPTGGMMNIVDTAAANGSFKIFGKALREAGLDKTLRAEGPFTLFAPTDAAFEKLPAGKLDSLLKPENKAELVSLINYHVLSGRNSALDMTKFSAVKTASGMSAPIQVKGEKVSFDGGEIVAPDIASSNGVLHGIDRVSWPTKH